MSDSRLIILFVTLDGYQNLKTTNRNPENQRMSTTTTSSQLYW